VWGKTYDIYLNKLWLLQKRAIRIISYCDYLAHTEALFKELKILPIKKVYVFSVAQFMFKYNRQLLPNIFDNMFTMNAFLHTYNTRQREHLRMPKHKLCIRTRTINVTGVRIWNLIEKDIKPHTMAVQSQKST
jgi:hypothetical protein